MSTRLVLVSRLRLETTRERIWQLLSRPQAWPNGWPHLANVEPLAAGDAEGIGASHRFRWRCGMGYGFSIVITTTLSQRLREIKGVSAGDLRGIGLWSSRKTGLAPCA